MLNSWIDFLFPELSLKIERIKLELKERASITWAVLRSDKEAIREHKNNLTNRRRGRSSVTSRVSP